METNSQEPVDAKRENVRRVISFRAPRIVQRQIENLKEVWGEDITHVIHRAITMAHEREFKRRRT